VEEAKKSSNGNDVGFVEEGLVAKAYNDRHDTLTSGCKHFQPDGVMCSQCFFSISTTMRNLTLCSRGPERHGSYEDPLPEVPV
jgi:hypothetical protein